MFNRKTIAAIVIATGAAAAPAFADDADARIAARLLEQARSFGSSDVKGAAAGETERDRTVRRSDAAPKSADEKRWAAILKSQSMN